MKKGLWIIVAVIAALLISAFSSYNSLVTLSENVDSQWSQVENQLQRRADLIPNLVETVKGYAQHEEEIFKSVSEARSRLLNAQGVEESAQANAQLTGALGRLLAIAEAYPQLRANENFIRLQDELAGTENRIATARRDYNQAVQAYNTKIKRFPTVIFARILGFESREYFQADEGAQQVPQVNFGS